MNILRMIHEQTARLEDRRQDPIPKPSKTFHLEPGMLSQLSGMLGQQGYYKEAIRLVLPIYDPSKHGVSTGCNLLQACIDTQNRSLGLALLQRMRDSYDTFEHNPFADYEKLLSDLS